MSTLSKAELQAGGFTDAATEWFGNAFANQMDANGFTRLKSVVAALSSSVAPVALAMPTISGDPKVGNVLTALHGDYTTTPTSYSQRWFADGNVISGATGATYTLTAAEYGKTVTFGEIPTNAGGTGREYVTTGILVTGTITLNALTLSSGSVTTGQTSTINILGATNGSTLSGTVPTGMTLNSAARTITGTISTANTYNFTITETISGVTKQTTLSIVASAAPTLAALTLSASTIAENSAAGTVVGALSGRTNGSTLTLVNDASGRFAISGGNLVAGSTSTDYETATSHQIVVRETMAGYSNSPRDTTLTVTVTNVFEQPNLQALAFSTTTLTAGTPANGTILNATAGSTIVASNLPTGVVVNGAARTWSYDGSGAANTTTLTLVETLSDSANSPRSTQIGVTTNAVITLGALSLSANTVTENTASGQIIGAILGKTAGSTLVLQDSAGGRFQLTGTNITTGSVATDYETATSHQIVVREILSGASNTPKDTTLTIGVNNVFEQPNLQALNLSTTTFIIGSPSSGAITGATAGSTIVGVNLPQGFTITGSNRTWSYDGSGNVGTVTINLTETLADSANSPKATAITANLSNGAPIEDWRMPATVSVSSGISSAQTALATAQATAASKTRPSFTVLAGGVEYVEWTVTQAGKLCLSWIGQTKDTTVTITQNGTNVNFTVQTPGGSGTDGDIDAIAGGRRQFVLRDVAVNDVIRMTVSVGSVGTVTISPLLHKKPVGNVAHSFVGYGSTREQQGWGCKAMEDAIIAAYPNADPLFFNPSFGGQLLSGVVSVVNTWATTYAPIADYVILGSVLGNDVTANRPWATGQNAALVTSLDSLKTKLNSAGHATSRIFLTETSFRQYSAAPAVVLPDQTAGSYPYNLNILEPWMATNLPHCWDSSLMRSRLDDYAQILRYRSELTDGVLGAYPRSIATVVESLLPYLRNGAWTAAANRIEPVVALAEATASDASATLIAAQAAQNEAQYQIDSLATSAAKTAYNTRFQTIRGNVYYKAALAAVVNYEGAKTSEAKAAATSAMSALSGLEGTTSRVTALQARIDAVGTMTILRTVKIHSGSDTAPDASFNSVNEANGSGTKISNLKDINGNATGFSYNFTSNITKQTGTNTALTSNISWLPDAALSTTIFSNSSPSTFELAGLDDTKVYDLYLHAARTGAGADKNTIFTVNGTDLVPQQNANNNTSVTSAAYNITSSGGKVSISVRPGSPNSGYWYLSNMRLDEKAPASAQKAITPTNWDFVAFGDQRFDQTIGGSLNAAGYNFTSINTGIASWLPMVTGHRLRLGVNPNYGITLGGTAYGAAVPRKNNAGVVVNSSPQTWYRGSDTQNKGIDYVANDAAGIVIVLIGWNDANSEYAGASRVNLLSILNGFRPNQLKIVLNEVAQGRGSAGTVPNSNTQQYLDYADWIRTLDCRSSNGNSRSDVIVVDTFARTYDTVAKMTKPGYLTTPALPTLTPWGAKDLASAINDRLALEYGTAYTNLPIAVTLPFQNAAPFLNSNPIMTPGTDGTVLTSGYSYATTPLAAAVPQGWTVSGTGTSGGMNFVCDKSGVDADGFPVFKVTVTGTLADQQQGGIRIFQAFQGPMSFTEKLRGVGKIKVDTGSKCFNGATLTLSLGESTANRSMTVSDLTGTVGDPSNRLGYLVNSDGNEVVGDWETRMTALLDVANPNMSTANGGPGSATTLNGNGLSVTAQFNFINYTGSTQNVYAVCYVSRLGILKVDSTPPTLQAVSPSSQIVVVGTPSSGTIDGTTAGSTLAVSSLPPGYTVNTALRTWKYDGSGPASTTPITFTETLNGATNSPKSSVINLITASNPALQPVTMSSSDFVVGIPMTGTFGNTTPGSTLTLSNPLAGLTINSAARTWSYDGTGTVGSGTMTIIETLGGSPNSPKSTNINWTTVAAAQPLLFGGRMQPMGGAYTFSSGDTDSNTRIATWNNTGVPVNKVKVAFGNWIDSGNTEVDNTNPITISAAFEYNGVITQLTFDGGSTTKIIAPGATVLTDELTLPTAVPADGACFIRTQVVVNAGEKFPVGYVINTSFSEAADFATGVSKVLSGTITNATATTTRRGFGPIGMIATSVTGTRRARSFAVVGDGTIGASGRADFHGNTGWAANSLYLKFPCFNMTVSGARADLAGANFTRRLDLLKKLGITDVIIGLGGGDIGNNKTADSTNQALQGFWNALNKSGMRITQTTLLPFAVTTSQYPDPGIFHTTSSQYPKYSLTSPAAGQYTGGSTSQRALTNAFIRSKPAPVSAVFDSADLSEVMRDSSIWISGSLTPTPSKLPAPLLGQALLAGTTAGSLVVNTNYNSATAFGNGGRVLFRTGPNAGYSISPITNSNTAISVSGLVATPNVGDIVDLYPGLDMGTNDGSNPSVPSIFSNGIPQYGTSARLTEQFINYLTYQADGTLKPLVLSSPYLFDKSAPGTVLGTLLWTTPGSTLTLVDSAGGRFALNGTNVVAGTTATDYYDSAGRTFTITVRETLAGASNSPRDTVITIGIQLTQPLAPYKFVDNFDSTRTVTSGAAQASVTGLAIGVYSLQVSALGIQNVTVSNTNIGTDGTTASWAGQLLAVQVDYGDLPALAHISNIRPTIISNGTSYTFQTDGANNSAQPVHGRHSLRGRRWISFSPNYLRVTDFNGARLDADVALGTRQHALQIQQGTNSDFNAVIKLDNFVRITTPKKPQIAITVDGCNVETITQMAARLKTICTNKNVSITPTSYLSTGVLDSNATKLTTAQALSLKNDFGWVHGMAGSPNDDALSIYATPNDVLTDLTNQRTALINAGLMDLRNSRHLRYAYGSAAYRNTGTSAIAIPTGGSITTITLNVANAAYNGGIMGGMIVKGTGLATAPTVVNTPTGTTVQLSVPVNFSANTNLVFCGNQTGVLVTCNGTTTIGCDTTYLAKGQVMRGLNVPAGTVIVDIPTEGTSGTITVSNAVPVTCTRASFYLESGAFYSGRLGDVLYSGGWRTGRIGHEPGGVCTQFGTPDPRLAMEFPGYNVDSSAATSAKIIADINMAVTNGWDMMLYLTPSSTQDWTQFETWINVLADLIASGKCTSPSVTDMVIEWSRRLQIN